MTRKIRRIFPAPRVPMKAAAILSFDVNAGVYFEDYPTLNISVGKSVSDFEVLGTDTTGSGDWLSSPWGPLISRGLRSFRTLR